MSPAQVDDIDFRILVEALRNGSLSAAGSVESHRPFDAGTVRRRLPMTGRSHRRGGGIPTYCLQNHPYSHDRHPRRFITSRWAAAHAQVRFTKSRRSCHAAGGTVWSPTSSCVATWYSFASCSAGAS
jgi:hypothetical protein